MLIPIIDFLVWDLWSWALREGGEDIIEVYYQLHSCLSKLEEELFSVNVKDVTHQYRSDFIPM